MKAYIREAMVKGGAAARRNIVPAVTLQLLAVLLIIGYYNVSSVREGLDQIGRWNMDWSPGFAIVMTMIFGGGIPLLVEAFQSGRGEQKTVSQVLFTLLLWALNGAMVCWFYQLQALMFGSEQDIPTVVKKVLVDQFVYVPVYVVPTFTVLFLWRDCHFSYRRLRQALQKRNLLERGLPLMISNWSVWIPAVSIIYAFPLPLQLVLMNFILVFWSLILSFFIQE